MIYYLLPPKWKRPTWKNHSFEDGNGTHAALLSFWILLSFILCKFFFKKDSFQKSTAKFLRIQQCSQSNLFGLTTHFFCVKRGTQLMGIGDMLSLVSTHFFCLGTKFLWRFFWQCAITKKHYLRTMAYVVLGLVA